MAAWKTQGHEIAGHHHGIEHDGWDGYSNLPKEQALAIRKEMGKTNEAYLGDLNAYLSELSKLNPNICSGCMNEEFDKGELPRGIIFGTCSGYANFGEPGKTWMIDTDPQKGRSEFVSVGTIDEVERRWLAHSAIFNAEQEKNAEKAFSALESGVYGVVTHSFSSQAKEMMKFMDFLHEKDPGGAKSKTIFEIINSKLLPEKQVTLPVKEAFSARDYLRKAKAATTKK